MVPALVVTVLQSYLAALGRTQVVLWVTLAAVVLNICVNYALIFGNWGAPELGVRGAAIATLVTQVLTLLVLSALCGLAACAAPLSPVPAVLAAGLARDAAGVRGWACRLG